MEKISALYLEDLAKLADALDKVDKASDWFYITGPVVFTDGGQNYPFVYEDDSWWLDVENITDYEE